MSVEGFVADGETHEDRLALGNPSTRRTMHTTEPKSIRLSEAGSKGRSFVRDDNAIGCLTVSKHRCMDLRDERR